MASTLKHPAVSPTTTITFDGVIDISRGRTATNTSDFGSIDGKSRQAASKRTQARVQISFYFTTGGGTSARDKVKVLSDLYKTVADADWELFLDFGGGESITYVGKLVSEDGGFDGGIAAIKYIGSLDMNVKTVTWS